MRHLMQTRPTTRRVAAVATLVLLALPVSACSQDEGAVDTDDAVETTDDDPTEPEAGADPESLSFDEVSDDLAGRAGEEVTVTAQVDDVVTDQVFTITSLDGTTLEPIVVVGAETSEVIEADTPIRVTGVVADTFVLTDVEETVGIQLDDEILGNFENRPYLEATHIETDVSDEAAEEAANES
jgi:hypothetical protein